MINYDVWDLGAWLWVAFCIGVFFGAWFASGLSFIEYIKKFY